MALYTNGSEGMKDQMVLYTNGAEGRKWFCIQMVLME